MPHCLLLAGSLRSSRLVRSTGIATGRLIALGILLCAACFAPTPASAQLAEFVSPSADTTDVGAEVTFAWSAVEGAQAYYLYLGTSSGAKDIVNTGEIQSLSYTTRDLPRGVTLYARIWVKVDGTWRYTERVIRTLVDARLVQPLDQAVEVPLDVEFRWQRINGAEKYYLYVGTAPGLKDVVNSGETLGTSFRARTLLPEGELLYARLWTRRDNAWHYTDSTFRSRALSARLTSPRTGATDVHPRPTLTWTSVPSAVSYYVYIGTTVGAKDVVNSGELKSTQLLTAPLQGARRYYLRLWTRSDDRWRYRDYQFTTRDFAAMVSPRPGASGQDPDLSIAWNSVNGAEKYLVQVGSSAGGSDLYRSSEMAGTQVIARGLPGGMEVHVRVWTRIAGAWKYEDSVVSTRAVPRFVTPRAGSIGVATTSSFAWTPVQGATLYQLSVGSRQGAADLFGPIETTASSLTVDNLPASEALYARISARVASGWVHADTVFATQASVRSAWMVSPSPGGRVSGAELFRWQPVAVASGYQLTIGTSAGAMDLFDSGIVTVTSQRIEALPQGLLLHGRLTTYYPFSRAVYRDFTFTAGDLAITDDQRLELAVQMAGDVRRDAVGNEPRPLSALAGVLRGYNEDRANCSRFAQAMLVMLGQVKLGVTARLVGTCLVPNTYDCHTLVELWDAVRQQWVLSDPTFGLAPRDVATGGRATLVTMGNAARGRDWGAISYEYFTSEGDRYAREYYLDYPLLFVQPMAPGQSRPLWDLAPVEDLYQSLGTRLPGTSWELVAVKCAPGATSVAVIEEGSLEYVPCHASLALTWVFGVRDLAIAETESQDAEIVRPVRVQFTN